MIWRRKITSSESDDSDHSCTEEEKVVAKPSVRLNSTPRNKAHRRAKNSQADIATAENHKIISWEQHIKARVEENLPTGLGIEVERNDPVPESILVDAQEARNAEIQRQVQFEDGTKPTKSRKSKEGKRRKSRSISMERSLDLEAQRVEKEARMLNRERRRESQKDKENQQGRVLHGKDCDVRHKEKETRRRQNPKRMGASEPLVNVASDVREGSSRDRTRVNREIMANERREEGSMHFGTSDSDCRAALRHAERQRQTLMQHIQTHRREQIHEAKSSRSHRASNLPDLDAGEVPRREKKRVRKHNMGREESVAFESGDREVDDSRSPKFDSRSPRTDSERAKAASRRAIETSGTQEEASNTTTSESTSPALPPTQIPISASPHFTEKVPQTSPQTNPPPPPSESPQDRALRYVRAAERDRQRILQTPPDMYHTRIQPPPRDEYSTVDEDIPPYRAQLHKYLDLVLYDERFTPILRVNRYLVNGDSELSAAIDKLTQFNLLPKQTNLWSISHIDDNDYEQMIPVLIPESSYYSEVALF